MPARIAPKSSSGGSFRSSGAGRQRRSTAHTARNETAFKANVAPAPAAAAAKPPIAGPTARATFIEMPFSAAPDWISSRGTRSGMIATSGSGASEVISQAAPTFWIHEPRLEARLAIQSARNIGRRNGAQGSALRRSPSASGERAIAPVRSHSSPAFRGRARFSKKVEDRITPIFVVETRPTARPVGGEPHAPGERDEEQRRAERSPERI